MKYLVTGGAGFIGSHLCEYLVNQDEEVICLDNFFTGSKGNIRHLLDYDYFEIIRHDVVEPILLEVDRIFHLACPASPVYYQYNPIKTIKTNVLGTHNMLGLAKRVGARFVLASTSEVYGDPLESPQKEEYWGNVNSIGPRSCYDEGKRVAESLCVNYNGENGVDVRIARIFNTFGERMAVDDGRVISNFIISALTGVDLVIHGDGSQRRAFMYIDDLIDGILKLMSADSPRTPVNLGNPENDMSIRHLAEKIIGMSESRSGIRYTDKRVDDPVLRSPDITRAYEELQWTPKIFIDEGLGNTIEYFKKII